MVQVNIFGIPRFKKYSSRSIRTTVDRLKRKNIIEKELDSYDAKDKNDISL